jgi:glycerol-3-phosphate cytidylyltransferase
MKSALLVGGSNGLGHAIALNLIRKGYDKIYILGRHAPETMSQKFIYHHFDLSKDSLDILSEFDNINTVIITSGIGRVAAFDNFSESEIEKTFRINTVSIIKIIHYFYLRLQSDSCFYFAIVSSISSLISSPLFSLYAATKAALTRFIESINIELEKICSNNRILNICPGILKGTSFYGDKSDFPSLMSLGNEIIEKMMLRETLFIPQYEDIYKDVLKRYHQNPHIFGLDSYDHKMKSGRINTKSLIKIGYLSGTFDLFHIGHLNILYQAKEHCDYLIVGVHKDGSHKNKETFIPFKERYRIIESIKYVDLVIEAKHEDVDVYDDIKYNFLFVGSDYKGTERFKKYEDYFKDKDVDIIYFPYTKETSSTQLRSIINQYLIHDK